METRKAEAEAVAELVRESTDAQVLTVADPKTGQLVPVLLSRKDVAVHEVNFEKFRDAPLRRHGTATAATPGSFIQMVLRNENEDSAVFAKCDSPTDMSLLAVIDYNGKGPEGAPRFGKHRIKYSFPISDEWAFWTSRNGKEMRQDEFAAFIESRIADLGDPTSASEGAKAFAALIGCDIATPARILELSRGLSVRVDSKVGGQINLSSGERQITYSEGHNDEAGKPIKVPGAFLLQIPVFKDDGNYAIPVRLFYRISGGAVLWNYQLYRADKALDDAFKRAVDQVKDAVKSEVFFGSPE